MGESVTSPDQTGNVIVKNLDPSIDTKALYVAFSPFGAILSCKVPQGKNGSKCHGFVHFNSWTSASAAIDAMTGSLFGGKKIYVSHFQSRDQRSPDLDGRGQLSSLMSASRCRTVYLNNIAPTADNGNLKFLCSSYGDVSSIKIIREADGSSKGFAFISFKTSEEAAQAIQSLNGKDVDGRVLFAGPAKKRTGKRPYQLPQNVTPERLSTRPQLAQQKWQIQEEGQPSRLTSNEVLATNEQDQQHQLYPSQKSLTENVKSKHSQPPQQQPQSQPQQRLHGLPNRTSQLQQICHKLLLQPNQIFKQPQKSLISPVHSEGKEESSEGKRYLNSEVLSQKLPLSTVSPELNQCEEKEYQIVCCNHIKSIDDCHEGSRISLENHSNDKCMQVLYHQEHSTFLEDEDRNIRQKACEPRRKEQQNQAESVQHEETIEVDINDKTSQNKLNQCAPLQTQSDRSEFLPEITLNRPESHVQLQLKCHQEKRDHREHQQHPHQRIDEHQKLQLTDTMKLQKQTQTQQPDEQNLKHQLHRHHQQHQQHAHLPRPLLLSLQISGSTCPPPPQHPNEFHPQPYLQPIHQPRNGGNATSLPLMDLIYIPQCSLNASFPNNHNIMLCGESKQNHLGFEQPVNGIDWQMHQEPIQSHLSQQHQQQKIVSFPNSFVLHPLLPGNSQTVNQQLPMAQTHNLSIQDRICLLQQCQNQHVQHQAQIQSQQQQQQQRHANLENTLANSAPQGVNLYVKHLDEEVDDVMLRKMFSRFGEVVSAKVMMEGNKSRGFGFVCFARAEDAARATRDIRRKGDDANKKQLYVAPAQRKEERQAFFREKLKSRLSQPVCGVSPDTINDAAKRVVGKELNSLSKGDPEEDVMTSSTVGDENTNEDAKSMSKRENDTLKLPDELLNFIKDSDNNSEPFSRPVHQTVKKCLLTQQLPPKKQLIYELIFECMDAARFQTPLFSPSLQHNDSESNAEGFGSSQSEATLVPFSFFDQGNEVLLESLASVLNPVCSDQSSSGHLLKAFSDLQQNIRATDDYAERQVANERDGDGVFGDECWQRVGGLHQNEQTEYRSTIVRTRPIGPRSMWELPLPETNDKSVDLNEPTLSVHEDPIHSPVKLSPCLEFQVNDRLDSSEDRLTHTLSSNREWPPCRDISNYHHYTQGSTYDGRFQKFLIDRRTESRDDFSNQSEYSLGEKDSLMTKKQQRSGDIMDLKRASTSENGKGYSGQEPGWNSSLKDVKRAMSFSHSNYPGGFGKSGCKPCPRETFPSFHGHSLKRRWRSSFDIASGSSHNWNKLDPWSRQFWWADQDQKSSVVFTDIEEVTDMVLSANRAVFNPDDGQALQYPTASQDPSGVSRLHGMRDLSGAAVTFEPKNDCRSRIATTVCPLATMSSNPENWIFEEDSTFLSAISCMTCEQQKMILSSTVKARVISLTQTMWKERDERIQPFLVLLIDNWTASEVVEKLTLMILELDVGEILNCLLSRHTLHSLVREGLDQMLSSLSKYFDVTIAFAECSNTADSS